MVNNMNHFSVKTQTVMVNNITVTEWSILLTINCFRGVIAVFHIAVVGYIVDHNYFRFDRGVVHIVVAGYIVDHYCLMFDR